MNEFTVEQLLAEVGRLTLINSRLRGAVEEQQVQLQSLAVERDELAEERTALARRVDELTVSGEE